MTQCCIVTCLYKGYGTGDAWGAIAPSIFLEIGKIHFAPPIYLEIDKIHFAPAISRSIEGGTQNISH